MEGQLHPSDARRPDAPAPTPTATTGATPEPATTATPATSRALESDIECPLHTVLGELAQTAVMQQVLHLEGELLPRAALVDALEGWQQLYRLVRTQVCPATRDAPLTPADLAALVETAVPCLLSPGVPVAVQARLCRQLVACARCTSPQECPLGLA
jgi:hypothetical protein